jgi:hypothetical protein
VADWVAIASIVSGATVAVGVPFISSRLERRRLSWEGHQRRLDELRSLLDTAALRFTDALNLFYEINMQINNPPEGDFHPRLTKLATENTEKADEIMRDGVRINLRVGSDAPVAKAHGRAMTIHTVYEADLVSSLRQPEGRPPLAPWSEFSEDFRLFMEEARRIVGLGDQ